MNKLIRTTIAVLHGFVGIGAMAGGLAAILNPETPLGAPASMLEHTPFSDFLIPGILLFAVIGLGNTALLAIVLARPRIQSYTACVAGGALVVWIVVQCAMLRAIAAPHVIFFFIGAVQVFLGVIVLFRNRQFPANFVVRFFGMR
jgi:hypothetical protein